MTRLIAAAALLCAAPAASAPQHYPEDCEIVRIDRDGKQTRQSAQASTGRGTAKATASASGSSSSSLSMSSSSSSNGQSRASATASSTDENGRTVTMKRDETGCTVTVSERPIQGE